MGFHILAGWPIDLEGIARGAAAGLNPQHCLWALRQKLGSSVHVPHRGAIQYRDRFRTVLTSTVEQWSVARALSKELSSDDTVYCTGEDVGFPLAACCHGRSRPRLVIFAHNLDRPRARAALKLWRIHKTVWRWVTNSSLQSDFLTNRLGVSRRRVLLVGDETDTAFFTPGPARESPRPLIVSAGLERRDYRTLAVATSGLDVEVKITGFSPHAKASRSLLPSPLPSNWECRFHEWPDLVQLYRDAAVVVLSLQPMKFCAGLTTIMEAWACRRPVVATRTEGLREWIEGDDLVLAVEPNDPVALRRAIERVVSDADLAERLARNGHRRVVSTGTQEAWLERVLPIIRGDRDVSR